MLAVTDIVNTADLVRHFGRKALKKDAWWFWMVRTGYQPDETDQGPADVCALLEYGVNVDKTIAAISDEDSEMGLDQDMVVDLVFRLCHPLEQDWPNEPALIRLGQQIHEAPSAPLIVAASKIERPFTLPVGSREQAG